MSKRSLGVILILTTLLAGSLLFNGIQATTPSSGPYYLSVPTSTWSYQVGKFSNGSYYMVHYDDWKVDYQTTNASSLFNAAFGNLTAGGEVFAQNGVYVIDEPISITTSNCTLMGEGIGTVLKAGTSLNDNVLEITGNGVKDVHIDNLAIDGNDPGNTAGNGLYINTPYVSWDSCHILTRLHISYTDGDAIAVEGDTRVCYFDNLNIQYPGEHGIDLAGTDHYLSNIEVGFAGQSGIKITATSSKFVNIKCFACGTDNYHATGYCDNAGFLLKGTDAACYLTFTDCTAEDSKYNGWLLYNGVRDDAFVNCWAQDCSTVTTGWDSWNITTACYRLTFTNCWARDGSDGDPYRGFGCYAGNYQMSFTGCQATIQLDTGLYLGDSDYCTVTGGFYASNGDWGIEEAAGATYNILVGIQSPSDSTGGIYTLTGGSSKCNLCYNGTSWLS